MFYASTIALSSLFAEEIETPEKALLEEIAVAEVSEPQESVSFEESEALEASSSLDEASGAEDYDDVDSRSSGGFAVSILGGISYRNTEVDSVAIANNRRIKVVVGGAGYYTGLQASYDCVSNCWFYGVDVFGVKHFGDADYIDEDLLNARFELEKEYTFGIAAKVGKVIGDGAYVFLRGGGVYSRFDFFSKSAIIVQDARKKVSKAGALVGIGTEFPISDCWSAGFSYDHVFYQKVDFEQS